MASHIYYRKIYQKGSTTRYRLYRDFLISTYIVGTRYFRISYTHVDFFSMVFPNWSRRVMLESILDDVGCTFNSQCCGDGNRHSPVMFHLKAIEAQPRDNKGLHTDHPFGRV